MTDDYLIRRTLSHYKIISKLGTGGMGEVYLAEDMILARMVALKVLPPEMASDPQKLERFQREARILAALSHPNIVTIHSVEKEEEIHFITMEFIKGSPLADLIPPHGFDFETLMEYALPVAEALSAAHEKGITHRDLKPGNIMIREGTGIVKILDFGLAKFVATPDRAELETVSQLTRDGVLVGTVPYMSPEQIDGKSIDTRTDIFSYGVLLYELATGRRPFHGSTALSVLSSILKDTPAAITEWKSDFPPQIDYIIQRCLRKDPEMRFQTMEEVCAQLRNSDATRGATVAPRSGASIAAPGSPIPEGPSIAVLPFRNIGGDTEQEYFADGLTEDIIAGLSRYRWFFVISRNSSFVFKDRTIDVRRVSQDLGARYILQGSVRRSGNRIRLTAELADGGSGNTVWAERFDRSLEDIFSLQEDLTLTIAGSMEPELSRAERRRVISKRVENLNSWDLYQRGFSHLHKRTREDLETAERLLARALELDPNFVPVLSAMAEVCFFQIVGGYTDSPSERADIGLAFGLRAVELDPVDAASHYALGRIHMVRREHESAITALKKAIELNPSYAWAHYALGMALGTSGRPEDAIPHIEAAMRLSPHDPYMGQFMVRMSEALLFMRRHEEALTWAEKSLREPNIQWSRYAIFISALGHLHRIEEARKATESLLTMRPGISIRAIVDWWPISSADARDHLAEGLRKAGFPE